MSPEQARGKSVDKRTDIWAFGCVLYEMLTGRSAFRGDDVSATLAQILEREPDWKALPSTTPASARRVLARCLEKDPKGRLRDAGDATLDLNTTVLEMPAETADVWWKRLVWVSIGVLVGVVVASWAGSGDSEITGPPSLVRFQTEPVSSIHASPPFALSSDGSRLAYVGEHEGRRHLFLRRLDSAEAELIRGTEDARMPFFSPDSRSIGFRTIERRLFVMPLGRGSPALLSLASTRGASWDTDDTIVHALGNAGGLSRIAVDGGVESLTRIDESREEVSHRWPDVLPEGRGVLFALNYATTDSWDHADIAIAPANGGAHRILIEGGTSPRYLPTGHIVYARDGNLVAAPFDLEKLELTGPPIDVLEGLITSPLNGSAYFAVADNGALAVMRGGSQPTVRQLFWVDRHGSEEPLPIEPTSVMRVDVSPDGTSLAIDVESAQADVWNYDLDRDVMTRLTFQGLNTLLGWSYDGSKVLFSSLNDFRIWRTRSDGSGEREPIGNRFGRSASASSDGRLVAHAAPAPDGQNDIWIWSETRSDYEVFVQTRFDEKQPKFSPDDRWLAYTSDESGQQEVYVAPYPGPGRRWQVSTEGGRDPIWGPDGAELFFMSLLGDTVMATELERHPEFRPRRPRVLFEGNFSLYAGADGPVFDIHPDGKRFVLMRDVAPEPVPIEITLNWFTELERLVPTP